jgi:Amt family ammonium transporter
VIGAFMPKETTMIRKIACGVGAVGASLFAATAAFAQEAASAASEAATAAASAATEVAAAAVPALIKAPAVADQAALVNKGDTTWMLVSSVLVLLMSIPGLALFYGGLVRTKNMLSVLMQVFMIVAITGLLWALYGYSLAAPTPPRSRTTSTSRNCPTSCSR